MAHYFCHVEIPTTDINKAKEFYTALFGWKVNPTPDMEYALFETGERPGGGFMKVDQVMTGGVVNYVLVDDIEATLTKVEELGGKIVKGKTQVEDMGWFGLFSDPDGNILGIWKNRA